MSKDQLTKIEKNIMKTFSAAFSFTILLLSIGCNFKTPQLKGIYQDKTYEFITSVSKEKVWNKLLDFFTTEGLVIKTIDKTSGLIVTDITSFLNSYTREAKDGSLIDSNAKVVYSKVRGQLTFALTNKPDVITGQWIVRVKEQADTTIVGIKLANIDGRIVLQDSSANRIVPEANYKLIVKSTGVFEKAVQAALK